MSLSTSTLVHEWTLAGGDRIGVERFDFDQEIGTLAKGVSGHVLQIGSRSDVIDRLAPWRAMFSHCGFVGMDLQTGPNVDVTADITAPIAQLRRSLGRKSVNAILCRHVLEHVQMPWEAARNIRFLLETGGLLFVTVPWVQGYHEFPHDYWRMSFAGLKVLFPDFSWEMEFYTGAREDHAYRLLWNGTPEHSERTLRIERNLFQLLIEEDLGQDAFDGKSSCRGTTCRPAP